MDGKQRRQLRRELLAKAMHYAREGKAIDDFQADAMDEAEEAGLDVAWVVEIIRLLMPLLLLLFKK